MKLFEHLFLAKEGVKSEVVGENFILLMNLRFERLKITG